MMGDRTDREIENMCETCRAITKVRHVKFPEGHPDKRMVGAWMCANCRARDVMRLRLVPINTAEFQVREMSERSDFDLLGWAVAHVGDYEYDRRPRWSHVANLFGLGSGSAHILCRRFGVDPDEMPPQGADPCAECPNAGSADF